jgi:hypothetical protein
MLPEMRQHVVSHWRVWPLVAVIVIAINEAVDRNFFDHREHIDGDVLLAGAALIIGFFGSYLVARRKTAGRSLELESRNEWKSIPSGVESNLVG